MHRGGGQAQPGGDSGWAEPLTATQPNYPPLQVGWGSLGAAMRDAGPVDQPGLAELLIAAPPTRRGRPGDPHLVGDVSDRARIGLDPPDQDASSRRGQAGVSVRHEASDERGAGTARTS